MIPFAPLLAASRVLPIGAVQAARDFDWWVDLLTSIATIVIALALIAIALAAIGLVLVARRGYLHVREVIARTRVDVKPILEQAETVAENVGFVSQTVRADVERFQTTISSAQERLDRAAEATEERIQQFNALLQVVQEEAEELFIDTASSLRGVKAGARVLREGEDGIEDDFDEVDAYPNTAPVRRNL